MNELTLQDVREADELEVVIDDFGFTGEGYLRLADGWLSVPGALPGERVRIRPEPAREGARRIYARLLEVLTASEARRDPLCDRAAYCRGCHLRHATIDEELRFHVRTVREVVARYAGLEPDDQPPVELLTPEPISRGDAFRVRSNLNYRRTGDGAELGLMTPVREALVPMVGCPALTSPTQRLIATVSEALAALDDLPWDRQMAQEVAAGVSAFEPQPGLASVSVASPVHGRGLVELRLTAVDAETTFDQAVDAGPVGAFARALAERVAADVGVAVSAGQWRRVIEPPDRLRVPLCGLRLEVGFDDWFPATLRPSEVLYDRLMELLELDEEDRLLDIGSGIGTISLLAASRCKETVGLDINRDSVSTAEVNAIGHDIENARFVVGGWEKGLRTLAMDGERFEVATINPMREPLGRRALSYLSTLGVERLVYLGPSPAAAARDLGELRELGWRIDYLGAANLHPATYHVMLVARLRRA